MKVSCRYCGWKGNEGECEVKGFGDYCGEGDDGGWEEWDDFVCPKCKNPVSYSENDMELELKK